MTLNVRRYRQILLMITFLILKHFHSQDGGGRCFYDETTYKSSIIFSVITVLDTPDIDPLFIGLPYLGRVQENSPMVSTDGPCPIRQSIYQN